jgi:hypothetical protein
MKEFKNDMIKVLKNQIKNMEMKNSITQTKTQLKALFID